MNNVDEVVIDDIARIRVAMTFAQRANMRKVSFYLNDLEGVIERLQTLLDSHAELVRDKAALEAALNIRAIYTRCPECKCYLELESHEESCPHKLTEDRAREIKP